MIDFFWKTLIRPVLFRLPAEGVHYFAMGAFNGFAQVPGVQNATRWLFSNHDPVLKQTVLGLEFPNPIALAAGFDKNGRWIRALASLGFGSIEIGSITGQGQPGNPKPRLFRLPLDRALINRMGFNNEGSESVARRLEPQSRSFAPTILGINLGKTKTVPLENAIDDYLFSFHKLYSLGDYFVINVSSPNTPGLRSLQDRAPLTLLLKSLSQTNRELAAQKNTTPKPLLLKIAPDLSDPQVAEISDLVLETDVAGIIATNTTLSRAGLRTSPNRLEQIGSGGLSGQPLFVRSCEVVRILFERLQGRIPIFGVGGIFNGADAWRMIGSGASVTQVYTGFIYNGPGTAAALNRHLIGELAKSGLGSISQAVGRDCR